MGRDSNGRSDQIVRLIESTGPWPFTTQRIYRRLEHSLAVWRSRDHRKGLRTAEPGKSVPAGATLLRSLWMPWQLNWWIGVVFAAGSLLFLLGSVLSLEPTLTRKWSLDATAINAFFFAGSIPFTIAAYLQLFQAANAKVSDLSPQLSILNNIEKILNKPNESIGVSANDLGSSSQ